MGFQLRIVRNHESQEKPSCAPQKPQFYFDWIDEVGVEAKAMLGQHVSACAVSALLHHSVAE